MLDGGATGDTSYEIKMMTRKAEIKPRIVRKNVR